MLFLRSPTFVICESSKVPIKRFFFHRCTTREGRIFFIYYRGHLLSLKYITVFYLYWSFFVLPKMGHMPKIQASKNTIFLIVFGNK